MISSKRLTKQITLLFILFISFSSRSQEADLDYINLQTIFLNDLNNEASFFEGQIHLKDNTTLNGLVSLNRSHYGEYVTVIRNDDGCRNIPNQNIDHVLLFDNNAESNSKTTFLQINEDGKLYRLVYQNEKGTSVYDTSNRPFDELLIGEVVVQENDALNYIFDFWTSGPKKDLINYINKRDGKTYKRRDFKSLSTLFACL